jgi:hypothetical protein
MSGLRFGCRSLLALIAVIFSLSATSGAEAGRGHPGRGGGHTASYGGSHGGAMRVAYAQPSRMANVRVVRSYGGGGYGGGGYIHSGHAGGHAGRSVGYYAAPVRYVRPVTYRQTTYITRASGCRPSPRCICD